MSGLPDDLRVEPSPESADEPPPTPESMSLLLAAMVQTRLEAALLVLQLERERWIAIWRWGIVGGVALLLSTISALLLLVAWLPAAHRVAALAWITAACVAVWIVSRAMSRRSRIGTREVCGELAAAVAEDGRAVAAALRRPESHGT